MNGYSRAAALTAVLCFCLVILGAFVRLSHAGLGCPDWPVCYGKATWPSTEQAIELANQAFPERPVETDKAWKEQVHRHLAAIVGLGVLGLAVYPVRRRPGRVIVLLASATAALAGTLLYMRGAVEVAAGLSVVALALPLIGALQWRDQPWARYAAFLLALLIFQAMLGMWTVTWKLKPVVVMAHLMGGMAVFSMLCYLALASRKAGVAVAVRLPRFWLPLAFLVLALQIALGGWTSSNYAALACPDFPTCQGQWWPGTDFSEAFVLWRGIGVDYEGGILDQSARTAIHLSHRIGAIVTSAVLLILGLLCLREARLRGPGLALLLLLALQISLGIGNVIYGLPLAMATAHNGVAALLLLALLVLTVRARQGAKG